MSDLASVIAELPDDALLPVGYIRARLNAPVTPRADAIADYSCADVAKMLGRKPGTIRGWCARGELDGAYLLNGREWRIPAARLRAYLDAAQQPEREPSCMKPDLGAWRRIKR